MKCCYFYIDYTNAKEAKDGKVFALCLEHGKEQKNAWYWDKGYGPFEIKCQKCNKIIHNAIQPTQPSQS